MPVQRDPNPSPTPWYVVWVSPTTWHGTQQQFHILQTATPPSSGTSYAGGTVTTVEGPYSSQAAAERAVGSHTGTGTGPGTNNPHHQATQPAKLPKLPNPLAGIDEIGAVLKAFFSTVADWHFWASIGWIILGLILMIMGIRLWLGKPVLPSPPPIVPVPV